MAERVNLDAAMERYETAMWFNAAGPTEMVRTILDSVQDVPTLVAELRAARKVVDATRAAGVAVRSGASCFTELAKLVVAVEVYDQATTP